MADYLTQEDGYLENFRVSVFPLRDKSADDETARCSHAYCMLTCMFYKLEKVWNRCIPYESRKPIMPNPASIAVQAHPPSSRSYIRLRAEKMSSQFTRALPVTPSSFANMFIISSLSLSVLICLCPSSSRKLFRSGALIRLPQWAKQIP